MKRKLFTAGICLVLLALLALPVLAASQTQITLAASKTQLKPGDTVTVTVTAEKIDKCTQGGFLFTFDEAVFSYESGKSLPALRKYFAGVSTAGGRVAGFFMNGETAVEGELFSVTLKVKADAASGTYQLSGTPSFLSNGQKVACALRDVQVTVSGDGAAMKPPADGTVTGTTKPTVDASELPNPQLPTSAPEPGAPNTQQGAAIDPTTPGTIPQQESGYEDPPKTTFPWWIIAIAVAVAVGGALFLALEIRKGKGTQ